MPSPFVFITIYMQGRYCYPMSVDCMMEHLIVSAAFVVVCFPFEISRIRHEVIRYLGWTLPPFGICIPNSEVGSRINPVIETGRKWYRGTDKNCSLERGRSIWILNLVLQEKRSCECRTLDRKVMSANIQQTPGFCICKLDEYA